MTKVLRYKLRNYINGCLTLNDFELHQTALTLILAAFFLFLKSRSWVLLASVPDAVLTLLYINSLQSLQFCAFKRRETLIRNSTLKEISLNIKR